jgi:hypothetical protein
MQPIIYHAVMRTRGAAAGVVLFSRWGEASPYGIHELYNSARVCPAQGQPLDLEITLTGEGKESLAHQLKGRFVRLACHGISVRLR